MADSAKVKSLNQLLGMKLAIPGYQRPYKWTRKNVADLLGDIGQAMARDGGDGFRYRVGTVILHRNKTSGFLDVVDGQQRIITLLLIRRCLTGDRGFIEMDLANRVTQANLAANHAFIQDWFRMRQGEGPAVLRAFGRLLEAVVITVEDAAQAFQLFDSQNSRGRELDPHDLLKAYHLREMKGRLFEMQREVTRWEAVDPARIKKLFDQYLFPILRWSGRERSTPFTAQEIDAFKGIPDSSGYAYALRVRKAMPSYQITEPFLAGGDFFALTDHYLALLDYLRGVLQTDGRFARLNAVLKDRHMGKSVGFRYARTLFECALLHYFDRFSSLDEQAVKKLFTWAFMLRVDMETLGFASINRYAVGESRDRYTNVQPIFALIRRARLHTDITNLDIRTAPPDRGEDDRWMDLYQALREINGMEEGSL